MGFPSLDALDYRGDGAPGGPRKTYHKWVHVHILPWGSCWNSRPDLHRRRWSSHPAE